MPWKQGPIADNTAQLMGNRNQKEKEWEKTEKGKEGKRGIGWDQGKKVTLQKHGFLLSPYSWYLPSATHYLPIIPSNTESTYDLCLP